MRGALVMTLLIILIVLVPASCAALPYTTLVTISRKVTYKRTLSPLGGIVENAATVKISVSNNFSYPVAVSLYDLEEKARVVGARPEPAWRTSIAPGYELLGWRLEVSPREALEVTLDAVPLEDQPLRAEVYYYVNGEQAYPHERGGVWKLRVEVGDRLKIAIRLVNRLPRLFDGRSYVKTSITVLVSIPFPDDVLKLEDSNVEPSKLMANSWVLVVPEEEWLNVTYRVESLGAWGEVNLDPITITYSLLQQEFALAGPSGAKESERLASTLSALSETLASIRKGVEGSSKALALMADSLEAPGARSAEGVRGLSEALRDYSEYVAGLAAAVKSLSSRAKRSSELLVDVIAAIDPGQLANPSPELRELMYQLAALTYGLSAVSEQLESVSTGLKEISEGVEGLENATEVMTSLSAEIGELSRRLKGIAEQMSAMAGGLHRVEEYLETLSGAYRESARAMERQQRVQEFQRAFYTASRAWGYLGLRSSGLPVGYELSREGGKWVISSVRVRNTRGCYVTWLRVKAENGRLAGLEFEKRPENLTSVRVEYAREQGVVLIPIFSEAEGELAHPLAGRFSVIVESETKPKVSVTPLYVCEEDYVAVKHQEVSYTISIEMPVLSREKPPELPPVSVPEAPERRPLLFYLSLVLVLLLAVAWFARKAARREVKDVELAKLEEEIRELERKLASKEAEERRR